MLIRARYVKSTKNINTIYCRTKNVKFGACGPDNSYSKSIRQHKTGGAIIKNDVSLTCMTMINLATGWFEIVEITLFDLNEVMDGKD